MKKFVCAAVAALAAACGSVDEHRHLDGGNDSNGNSDGNVDAAPTGPAMLAMTPLTHEFGPVPVNTTSTAFKVTFRNTGGETAMGCSAPTKGGLHPGEFTLTNDTCGTNELAGGATCTVDVVAKPTIDGIRSMTLSRTCTVGGTATSTSNAYVVNRPMFIFATITEYGGNLGGLAGADAKCAASAAAGSLTAPKVLQWKALISTKTGTQVDAKDRFVWTGPLYDIGGTVVTFNPSVWPWVAPTSGGSNIRKDENGGIPGSYAATGTDVDGTALPADCAGWTSNANTAFATTGEIGSFPSSVWINEFNSGCDATYFELYCISQ
jgi:hypothetical protein